LRGVVRYKLMTCGDDAIACEAAPLDGPLNEFGLRTLVKLYGGEVFVRVSDLIKVGIYFHEEESKEVVDGDKEVRK